MSARRASCSCGQLELAVTGEPVRISMCHCRACQRRTGSPFGAQARFVEAEVEVDGQSATWTRIADSGNRITFHFCPNCGSTVFYRPEAEPELVAIAVGAFADPSFPRPSVSVYDDRRHAWIEIPDGIERMS
jgi:hypothetical protein